MHWWRRENRQTDSAVLSACAYLCAIGVALSVTGPIVALAAEEAATAGSKAKTPAAGKTPADHPTELQKPDPRVRWTTSHVVGSPEPPYPYVFRRVFPGLKFDKPVYMIPEPGTDRIFILQYPNGLVFAIRDDQKTTESKQILRFPVGKDQSCECLSIIFHPNYVKNRQVFIFANVRRREGSNGQRQERDQIVDCLRCGFDLGERTPNESKDYRVILFRRIVTLAAQRPSANTDPSRACRS